MQSSVKNGFISFLFYLCFWIVMFYKVYMQKNAHNIWTFQQLWCSICIYLNWIQNWTLTIWNLLLNHPKLFLYIFMIFFIALAKRVLIFDISNDFHCPYPYNKNAIEIPFFRHFKQPNGYDRHPHRFIGKVKFFGLNWT